MIKHIANIVTGGRILGSGLLLFLLPLTLSFIELKYSSIVVCSVATCAAIQEGVYIVMDCKNQ